MKKGDKVIVEKVPPGANEKFNGRTGTVVALKKQIGILFADIRLDPVADESFPVTVINARHYKPVPKKTRKTKKQTK